jgi:hypothetical protein
MRVSRKKVNLKTVRVPSTAEVPAAGIKLVSGVREGDLDSDHRCKKYNRRLRST